MLNTQNPRDISVSDAWLANPGSTQFCQCRCVWSYRQTSGKWNQPTTSVSASDLELYDRSHHQLTDTSRNAALQGCHFPQSSFYHWQLRGHGVPDCREGLLSRCTGRRSGYFSWEYQNQSRGCQGCMWMPHGDHLVTKHRAQRWLGSAVLKRRMGGESSAGVTYVVCSQYRWRRTHSWRNGHNCEQPSPWGPDGSFCCNTEEKTSHSWQCLVPKSNWECDQILSVIKRRPHFPHATRLEEVTAGHQWPDEGCPFIPQIAETVWCQKDKG